MSDTTTIKLTVGAITVEVTTTNKAQAPKPARKYKARRKPAVKRGRTIKGRVGPGVPARTRS